MEFLRNEHPQGSGWEARSHVAVGKYDQTFIREDGKWKYLEFRWYVIFRTPYEDGWVKTPIVGGLHDEGFPDVGSLYTPYDPLLDSNSFFPAPPEPEE